MQKSSCCGGGVWGYVARSDSRAWESGMASSAGVRSFRGLGVVAYRVATHSEDARGSRNLENGRHQGGDRPMRTWREWSADSGVSTDGIRRTCLTEPVQVGALAPAANTARSARTTAVPGGGHGARTDAGAACAGNKRTIDRLRRDGHHVSMHGRFLPLRGGGGGQARSPSTIQRRVSAGSITSSISNSEAVLIALPCSYMPATRSS